MIKLFRTPLALALSILFASTVAATAAGILDGRAFTGMIGPAENPDLDDSLHFNDGHFWSDICTRCGFVPGTYDAEETPDGVRFTGTLESDSRGRFDYDGLVKKDGSIQVKITWERRRWYWTSRREISFVGDELRSVETTSLSQMLQSMRSLNPHGNPMCARF
ncbi:hypothetical protein [Lutimaribacter saemankumensis]|uniref:Uncharacterized protein n=1 Tax=Lutimaribacter saemankumensis TaxID=490829 RepID=A0A1G8T8B8_9RHOB|nr:hypothetical protein [Lutimaribacter saemankumensis]SDJ37806.1 hypothetical protein SAMN05421850_11810 [Lutimaribacter saemankumensis]